MRDDYETTDVRGAAEFERRRAEDAGEGEDYERPTLAEIRRDEEESFWERHLRAERQG